MSKKAIFKLVTMITAAAIGAPASAMSIKINLDSAIDHQFSFGYAIYDVKSAGNASTRKINLEGVPVDKLENIVALANNALQGIEPGTSLSGEQSTVTLSYIKADGSVIAPASCKMIAKPVMNIFMNENGCTVS